MLKKKFFKTKDECEVTFELSADDAQKAAVVGEFNNWDVYATPMTRRSTSRRVRRAMSSWPRVMGSKDPGYRPTMGSGRAVVRSDGVMFGEGSEGRVPVPSGAGARRERKLVPPGVLEP